MSGSTPQATVARLFPALTQVEKGKTYHWCSCGLSKKQPFCDGSHKGTSFGPVAYEAKESKRVLFCMCKQTGTAPICDNAHIGLAVRTRGSKIAVAGVLGLGMLYAISASRPGCKKSNSSASCCGTVQKAPSLSTGNSSRVCPFRRAEQH
jgi:CDGSH-type Zn-finger protein